MKLSIRLLKDKQELNSFIFSEEIKPYIKFLQTWEWGDFQQSRGKEIRRIAVVNESDQIIATCLLIKERNKLGEYIYAGRGPVCDYSDVETFKSVVKEITSWVSQNFPAIFLRFDPAIVRTDGWHKTYKELGLKSATNFVQVERAWVADISKATDEASLIETLKEQGLKGNVRRGYQKAQKTGVTVRMSDSDEDLEKFVDMLYDLDRRKGIDLYQREHYIGQFKHLSPSGYERMFFAEYEGVPLAGAIIALCGEEVSYLHGASTAHHRNLMGPYFLQIEMMKYAIEHGYKKYNFWGVNSEKYMYPEHPRYGYSFFKRSFGGHEELYMRAGDYIFNPIRYYPIRALEFYRKKKFKYDD